METTDSLNEVVSAVFNAEREKPNDFSCRYFCDICRTKNYNPNLIKLDDNYGTSIFICKGCLTKMIQLLEKTYIENAVEQGRKKDEKNI